MTKIHPAFAEIAAGTVYRSPAGVEEVAINPRCALLPQGVLACSFMLQSGFGVNDFKPLFVFSRDGGLTWSEPRLIWPQLVDRLSCIGQISAIPGTDSLLFFGVGCPIDQPGEIYWREDIRGLKQNQLIWARSDDRGETWTEPETVAMPQAGSAEAQGPMLVTQDGTWLACYAPYRNWDPAAKVELNCLMQLRSCDQGKSWNFQRIMTFAEPESGAAEAWMAECGKDRLIATCWHTNLAATGGDFSNKYALSQDGGLSWSGPHDTAIQGQSTALLTLDERKVLFLYNQRKKGEPGIRAAVIELDNAGAKIVRDEMLWAAKSGTRSDSSGDHANWTDFSFGEPAMTRLNDGRFVLVFWEKGSSGQSGISLRVFAGSV